MLAQVNGRVVYRRRGEGAGRVVQLLAVVFLAWVGLSTASRGGALLVTEMAVVLVVFVGLAARFVRAGTIVGNAESVQIWTELTHRTVPWSDVAAIDVRNEPRRASAVSVPTLVLKSGDAVPLRAASEKLRSWGVPTGEAAELVAALDSLRQAALTYA